MTDDVPITVNATFCATLVDEWVRGGTTHAFVAPGSRSTPLALALAAHPALVIELFHDERSASFAALGHGLATGRPAIVVCSSGTAGSHFHAAVIEADLSCVPMLVCTADRPPELWGRGAPQVINQTELFGDIVRSFVEPGPPDDLEPTAWRPIAATAHRAALTPRPGPVHLNLSFRDPLTGSPGSLPPALSDETLDTEATPVVDVDAVEDAAALINGAQTGVIIAGRGQSNPDDVRELSRLVGWPVLSDHRSGCRGEGAIRHFDSLLRCSEFADGQRPEVIVRLGEIVSSKSTSQWIKAASDAGASVVATRPWGRLVDPEDVATLTVDGRGFVAALLPMVAARSDGRGQHAWNVADDAARQAIDQVLADQPRAEPNVARRVLEAVPAGGALVVASSMPVRDVEWFGPNRSDVAVVSNRGANGIDGTIATAIGVAGSGAANTGVASSRVPTICLVGDVAFLHDSSSMVALANRAIDLTIVVVDNDGGGIFSFLPQHTLLSSDRYEQLFGTPHGTDLAALVRSHGIDVVEWDDADPPDLTPEGVRVVRVASDRQANLALHDKLNAAVASAIS